MLMSMTYDNCEHGDRDSASLLKFVSSDFTWLLENYKSMCGNTSKDWSVILLYSCIYYFLSSVSFSKNCKYIGSYESMYTSHLAPIVEDKDCTDLCITFKLGKTTQFFFAEVNKWTSIFLTIVFLSNFSSSGAINALRTSQVPLIQSNTNLDL